MSDQGQENRSLGKKLVANEPMKTHPDIKSSEGGESVGREREGGGAISPGWRVD